MGVVYSTMSHGSYLAVQLSALCIGTNNFAKQNYLRNSDHYEKYKIYTCFKYSKKAYQSIVINIAFRHNKMDKKEYDILHQKVTHLLVRAREEAGLTQKQVSESKIISQSELSKIENGVRQIDFIILFRLCNLYKKDLTFFIPNNIK